MGMVSEGIEVVVSGSHRCVQTKRWGIMAVRQPNMPLLKRSYIGHLQNSPRVVLIVGNAAVALSSIHETGVYARVVHRRPAIVHLATVDKIADVGSIAAIIFFRLTLTPLAQEKPYTKAETCHCHDTNNNTHSNGDCVRLVIFVGRRGGLGGGRSCRCRGCGLG